MNNYMIRIKFEGETLNTVSGFGDNPMQAIDNLKKENFLNVPDLSKIYQIEAVTENGLTFHFECSFQW